MRPRTYAAKAMVAVGITAALLQPAAAEAKKIITPAVYQALQDYLNKLPKNRDGLFVVSDDGKRSGSFICPGDYCQLGSMIVLAMEQCVDENNQCQLLADHRRIVLPFEVEK